MRFRSRAKAAGRIFAVSGINTISFAVDAADRTKEGLLGFAVERIDADPDERYFMSGFKVFRSVVPQPIPGAHVSTFEHPVQSFVWDDFTAKPDHEYTYRFHPIKGSPRNLDRHDRPLSIRVRTEPLFSALEHDVFFNRGVASSQAYVRRFGDTPIDRLQPAKHEEALKWLSRDLDDAIVRFISSCACGDQLLACFYEFRYQPVAAELKGAIDRGVDVRIIIDAKVNGRTDGQGVVHESFPREENLALLAGSGIPDAQVIRRQARKSDIQHNKFMVRIAGGTQPVEVWTGSTNLSTGGIHGQTNVGHWVRDTAVADQFARYWQLLAGDPGGAVGDTRGQTISKNKVFKAAVRELSPAPLDLTEIPHGVTAVFSPRPDTSLLDSYAELLDSAGRQACITLAFGIASTFKEVLKDNTSASHLVFMLLEKRDRPSGNNNPAEYVRINASNNVYQAWGSFLRDPVYQWVAETSALQLGLNRHVSFIHSKFMLIDPLSADPIIVTGSANFSADSTKENDENMLLIRGDRRAADIYLTEFNRLFNHYYFRSVTEALQHRPQPGQESLFLAENADWQAKYEPGKLRAKRLQLFLDLAASRII